MADSTSRAAGDPRRPALRRCVAVEPAVFADAHWAERPLLSAAAALPGDFADLLTLDDVDELISRRGLRTPFLRIAKDGAVVDPARFTRSGGAGAEIADQVADDRVLDLFVDGATLVLQGLHRTWPPLIAFGQELQGELGHPVQVNAYVTPPENRGFAAHYDVHDVFVLQVAGEKRWVIHPPVLERPLRDQPWSGRAGCGGGGGPCRAGHRHRAPAGRRPVPAPWLAARGRGARRRVLPPDGRGAARDRPPPGRGARRRRGGRPGAARLAAARPRRRRPGPARAAPHRRDRRAPGLAARPPTPTRSPNGSGTGCGRRAGRSRSAPLAQAAALRRIDQSTVVRRRAHLAATLRPASGQLILELAGRRLTLPSSTEPALKALLGGDPVAVAELPGLDPDERLVLVRRLLREAVVVPASG